MKTSGQNLLSDRDWILAQHDLAKELDSERLGEFEEKLLADELLLPERVQLTFSLLMKAHNNDTESEKKAATMLTWFIFNYAESPFFTKLPVTRWSTEGLKIIEDAWEVQIKQSDLPSIRLNAVSTIGVADVQWSLGLLEHISEIERSTSVLQWLCRLYFLRYQQFTKKAEQVAKRGLHSADALLFESVQPGEHFGILKKAIPLAITLGDIQDADRMAGRLLQLGKEYHQELWKQFAYIFNARIALRKKKGVSTSLLKLKKSLNQMHAHAGASLEILELLKELQARAMAHDVIDLLTICIETTKYNDEGAVCLKRWLRELRRTGWTAFD